MTLKELIQGDKDKLKQVFINLVSNACEVFYPLRRVQKTVCQLEVIKLLKELELDWK